MGTDFWLSTFARQDYSLASEYARAGSACLNSFLGLIKWSRMQRSRQSDASWLMIQTAARADPRVVAGLEFYRAADAGDLG